MPLLFVFAAATAYAGFEALFECLKLRAELCEYRIVGIFLNHMVHETHGEHKLFGMFVFGKQPGFAGFVNHCGEVVMTAEIEVHDLAHLVIL